MIERPLIEREEEEEEEGGGGGGVSASMCRGDAALVCYFWAL